MSQLHEPAAVAVSAVVARPFHDGTRVLLAERLQDRPGQGEYGFPGGSLDPNEDPIDGVARELWEEAGMRPKSVEPLTWTYERWEDRNAHFVTLHYLIRSTDEPVNMEPHKHSAWYWFRLDRLPSPLVAPEGMAQVFRCLS